MPPDNPFTDLIPKQSQTATPDVAVGAGIFSDLIPTKAPRLTAAEIGAGAQDAMAGTYPGGPARATPRDLDKRPSFLGRAVAAVGHGLSTFGRSAAREAIEATGQTAEGLAEAMNRRPYYRPFYDAYQHFDKLSPDAQAQVHRQIDADPHLTPNDKQSLHEMFGDRASGEPALSFDQFAGLPPQATAPYRAGAAVERFGQRIPLTPQERSSLPGRIGSAVGGVAPALAAGALTGPVGAAAQFGFSTAGQQAEAARAKGAGERATAEAAQLGLALGGAAGALDVDAILRPLVRSAPGIIGWATGKLAQAARSGITFASIGEAQQYLADQIAKEYDPKARYSFDLQRAIADLLAGGGLGVVVPLRRPQPMPRPAPENAPQPHPVPPPIRTPPEFPPAAGPFPAPGSTVPTPGLPAVNTGPGIDTVITPRGTKVEVRPVVVDAARLVPSHTDDLTVNPNYPAELQPRQRTRTASAAQVADIAANLEPTLLGRTASATDGAPIVASDGVVESGNGRVLAIRRAYQHDLPGAARYRAWLAAQGYDTAGMSMPVLVRERVTDLTPDQRAAFAREANERTTMGLSAAEQAAADAEAMPDWLPDLYRGGDLTSGANRDLVTKFVDAVVSPAARGAFVTKDGALSQEGLRRIQNALFARAYGDVDLLGVLRESQESNIRTIGDAMLEAAPQWSRMRAAIARGEATPGADPTNAILAAARLVRDARTKGQPVADLVRQNDMFGGRLSPETESALHLFFRDPDLRRQRSKPDIAGALRFVAEQAERSKPGTGLFGGRPVTALDLLDLARARLEGGLMPDAAEARKPTAFDDLVPRVLDDLIPEEPTPELMAMQPGAKHVGFRRERPYVPGEERAANVIRRNTIIANLAKAFGVHVYEGRVKGKRLLGFFRQPTEEVRIKNPDDIETTTHEMAHLLDYRVPEIRKQWSPATKANKVFRDELAGVSYDKSKLYEGFAEFVRLWATQSAEAHARAPNFFAWFENFVNRSIYGRALREAQRDIHAWFEQAALDRARSKIGTAQSFRQSVQQFFDRLGDRLRQSILDDLHGIYSMERTQAGQAQPRGAYETARLVRGSRALITGAMQFGAPKALPDGSHTFEGKGLEQILAPVADHIDDFLLYAVGRSAGELQTQGREHLFTRAEIAGMKDLERPAFRQAFDEYQIWNQAILDFAQHKGIIDPDVRALWKRTQYLPFYRLGEAGGSSGTSYSPVAGDWRGIRALTGGSGNMRDVLGNMIQNASMLLNAALQNEARVAVADLANQEGGARYMVKIPREETVAKVGKDEVERTIIEALGVRNVHALPVEMQKFIDQIMQGMGGMVEFLQKGQAPVGRNVIAVMRHGKPEYYEVADPVLLRALMSLRRPARSKYVVPLTRVRRIMQAGVTLHPNFLAAHVARDAVMGTVLSKNGFKPLFDSTRGVLSRMQQDPNFKLWVANGGGFIGSHLDDSGFRRHLDAFYGSRGIDANLVLNSAHKLERWVERIADAFGSGTRLGEFQRAIAKGVHPRQAAFQSREIATDFSMRGDNALLGFFYDTVPFLNAATVSADRIIRGMYRGEEKRLLNIIRVGAVAGASVTLYAINSTIPLYQQLDEWDKDAHWHFFLPKHIVIGKSGLPIADPSLPLDQRYIHLRFPKAWEIGLIGTLAERTAGWMLGDPQWHNIGVQFVTAIGASEHVSFIPGFLAPLIEVGMNYNFLTGRPLHGEDLSNLQPWARTTSGTSPAMQDIGELERRLPTGMQVSPVTLETLIRGYLGNWGQTALAISDWMIAGLGGAPAPARRLDQYPLIRRFYEQAPSTTTQYVEAFYEALKQATQAHMTMTREGREGRLGIAGEIGQQEPTAEYHFLASADKAMAKFHHAHDAIMQAKDLAATRRVADALGLSSRFRQRPAWNDVAMLKRALLDAVTTERNTLAQQVMGAIRTHRIAVGQ